MYWNLPAACGEVIDDGHSSGETFCATFYCPCYWLCCGLTYCLVGGIELASSCSRTVKSLKASKTSKTSAQNIYEQREENAPQPLPLQLLPPQPLPPQPLPPRKRRLTLPLPINTQICPLAQPQKTLDQNQSPLFRLPIELREIIWNHVMGHRFILVWVGFIMRFKHLVSLPCVAMDPSCKPLRSFYPELVSAGLNGVAPQNFPIFALFKSCRRIYSETINLAYGQNTFSFDQLTCFRWFARSTLHFDLIKSHRLSWDPETFYSTLEKYHRADWQSFYQIILEMKALKDLRIKIIVKKPQSYQEARVPLDLLRDLDGLEIFQIYVPLSFRNTLPALPAKYECIGF